MYLSNFFTALLPGKLKTVKQAAWTSRETLPEHSRVKSLVVCFFFFLQYLVLSKSRTGEWSKFVVVALGLFDGPESNLSKRKALDPAHYCGMQYSPCIRDC